MPPAIRRHNISDITASFVPLEKRKEKEVKWILTAHPNYLTHSLAGWSQASSWRKKGDITL